MEVYRDITENFELTFPLTDRTIGDFVTGKAAELDSNTIIIHYHNATVWITASFAAGTPVEMGSSGYYHITILASWFTALDIAFPINVKIIDDAGTKTWKDQSVIVNHKLDAKELRDLQTSVDNLEGLVVEGVPKNEVATAQNVTNGTVDSGDYTNTQVQDDSYFQLSPNGSPLDADLTFNLNTSTPITVNIHGRYEAAASRYCDVYAWNYDASAWEKISTDETRLNHSVTDNDYSFTLLSRHKDGPTSDSKIRFLTDEGTASYNLYLDSVLVKAVIAGASPEEIADAVYLRMKNTVYGGAIWIDTINGVSGTDIGIHGISSNPVDNLADAITLASTVGVRTFCISPGSTLTLSQAFINWEFCGHEYTIALNNKDISGSVFNHASISGIATAPTGIPTFHGCDIGTVTLPETVMEECGFSDTVTLGDTGVDYIFDNCYSRVAGTGTPSVVFAANSNVNYRHYSGGIEIKSMAAGSNMSLEGDGQLKINASCTGGIVAIRGNFKITDSASGAVTLSDNARYDINQVRDAMKLAPAVGSPTADSVDKHLDDILSDTGNILIDTNEIQGALPVVGPIASQGDVQALSNNTRARISVPTFVQIPPTGDVMIPIQFYYFDDAGDPADPDNNEVAVQARAINGAAYKLAFFDDEAGTTGATASTTFTPNYLKLDKLATGQYQTFYKLPSTENTDIWQLIFKLEDTAVELAFPASMGILEEVPVLTLDDSTANRQIIAKSMKIEDVAGQSPVADSVYQDIIDDTNAIVAKLPTGTISDLALTSVIDGQTFGYILELIMALVNGRYLKDSPVAGQLTIFKRDNATTLTIIQITDTEGTRIS